MLRHVHLLIALLASAPTGVSWAQDSAQPASNAAQAASKQQADAKKPDKSAPPAAAAPGEVQSEAQSDVKTLSGISILGNQEAPKSLVIVPWKSSEIGEMSGLSRLLDDSIQPIDKDVFMRELDYYQIRSSSQ